MVLVKRKGPPAVSRRNARPRKKHSRSAYRWPDRYLPTREQATYRVQRLASCLSLDPRPRRHRRPGIPSFESSRMFFRSDDRPIPPRANLNWEVTRRRVPLSFFRGREKEGREGKRFPRDARVRIIAGKIDVLVPRTIVIPDKLPARSYSASPRSYRVILAIYR